MIAAFFLHNRVSAALLMRCRNAATALFSSVLGCYCRVGTLLHFDSACTATDLLLDPHASSLRNAGRMCEVGPPAQRRTSSLILIRAGGHSTGILLCEAGQLPLAQPGLKNKG